MMIMPLSEAAQVLHARQAGTDVIFHGVSIDTRTLVEGNLFVALKGPNFDGHRYLEQARDRGAVAAAVSESVDDGMPLLEVEDTRLALGQLAADWRSRFRVPLVAVTGSNGKTSVKEMLASILQQCGETLVTRGNFNNDIGVPLTLFRLTGSHQYAVLELGANHHGEIAYLAGLVQPQVAVINNAAAAHLEGFGDLDGVAHAKGELFEHLAADAVCVVNADDHYADLWRSLAGDRPMISFGLHSEADVTADWSGDVYGSDLELHTPSGSISLHLALPGQHNVMNALAASAAAVALNIPLDRIAAGLAATRPVGGRFKARNGVRGVRLIDDTYNANPDSLQAALELLSTSDTENWLVLGDMGELGDEGNQLHVRAGTAARLASVQRLFTLGELAQQAAFVFGEGAESFQDVDALLARLMAEVHDGVTVLVKGSRSMHMERVIHALADDAEVAGGGA